MRALVWALSALFLLAGIHPFVTYPLSLILVRRWSTTPSVRRSPAETSADIAICFCAYNEERVIQDKIANLIVLKDRLPTLEILAYVDAATDRTAELLRRHSERITVCVSPIRRGKTHGMNLLVSKTTAPIVVFTDANVIIDPAALGNLQRYFVDPQIGCVCGHLTYVNANESTTATVASLYWRFEERVKELESDTGSVMGADGSIFAIRRALHRPVPDELIDDAYLSFSILCDGYRVVRAADVRAFEEAHPVSQVEFQRKIRIGCQSFNVHRVLWPRIRRLDALSLYKYISHKFLRWLCIYSFLFSFIFFEAGLAMASAAVFGVEIAAATAATLAVYTGMIKGIKPFEQIGEFLLALVGTGIGVWRSLRGQHFQTWPSSSSISK